jgi:hypothetical protein
VVSVGSTIELEVRHYARVLVRFYGTRTSEEENLVENAGVGHVKQWSIIAVTYAHKHWIWLAVSEWKSHWFCGVLRYFGPSGN